MIIPYVRKKGLQACSKNTFMMFGASLKLHRMRPAFKIILDCVKNSKGPYMRRLYYLHCWVMDNNCTKINLRMSRLCDC